MESHQKIKALIVDDEHHARENLSFFIEEYCPEIEVAGTAEDATSALEVIKELRPEVIFLDIRMPSGAEGFDLLEKMPDYPFMVVFVTAFKDYAIRALNANAIHYLLKPVDLDELKQAVSKIVKTAQSMASKPEKASEYKSTLLSALKEITRQSQRIAIHHAHGIKMVGHSQILYLRAEGNCTMIEMTEGPHYLDTRTLKTYEDLLPAAQFIRVHRSYMVNVALIDELSRQNGLWVVMKNGHRIPVSRKRLPQLLEILTST